MILTRTTAALIVAASGIATSAANAQWSVVYLHPSAALTSRAYAMQGGNYQAGTVYVNSDGAVHAAAWSGSAASWVDLNPAGALNSEAFASSGIRQGGSAVVGGVQQASLWNGTAASWTSIHPAGATSSQVLGMDGGRQVGWTRSAGVRHAAVWSGTAASRIDLNPSGATQSIAYGAGFNRQAGAATLGGVLQAGIWTGTAASWTSLHPSGANYSEAVGISQNAGGAYQFGYAQFGAEQHAGLWRGSSASWFDLQPDGATNSYINAANGGFLAGAVDSRATLWSGSDFFDYTPEDLHAFLPPEFTSSSATGFSFDGANLYVSGFGRNSVTNQDEALLWVQGVPAPGTAALLGLGGLLAARRRR